MTPEENKRRQVMAMPPVCKRGHARTPDNFYIHHTTGHRTCRQCVRDKQNAKSAQRRDQPTEAALALGAFIEARNKVA